MDRVKAAGQKQEQVVTERQKDIEAQQRVAQERLAKRGELGVQLDEITKRIAEGESAAKEANNALTEVGKMEEAGELDPEVKAELMAIHQEAATIMQEFDGLKARKQELEKEVAALDTEGEQPESSAAEAGKEEKTFDAEKGQQENGATEAKQEASILGAEEQIKLKMQEVNSLFESSEGRKTLFEEGAEVIRALMDPKVMKGRFAQWKPQDSRGFELTREEFIKRELPGQLEEMIKNNPVLASIAEQYKEMKKDFSKELSRYAKSALVDEYEREPDQDERTFGKLFDIFESQLKKDEAWNFRLEKRRLITEDVRREEREKHAKSQ